MFCDKLPEESKQVSGLLVAYAKSVRPEVVVPSEKDSWFAYGKAWNDCIESIKSLNPTMTFTELNHEK